MAEEKSSSIKNLKLHNFEVTQQSGLDPKEARKALERMLREIPDEKLRNFRGAQVTVIK